MLWYFLNWNFASRPAAFGVSDGPIHIVAWNPISIAIGGSFFLLELLECNRWVILQHEAGGSETVVFCCFRKYQIYGESWGDNQNMSCLQSTLAFLCLCLGDLDYQVQTLCWRNTATNEEGWQIQFFEFGAPQLSRWLTLVTDKSDAE